MKIFWMFLWHQCHKIRNHKTLRKIKWCQRMLVDLSYSQDAHDNYFLCPSLMSVTHCWMFNPRNFFPEFVELLQNAKDWEGGEPYNSKYNNYVWNGDNYNRKRQFLNDLIKILKNKLK